MELPSTTIASTPPEFLRRTLSRIFDFFILAGLTAAVSLLFANIGSNTNLLWHPFTFLALPLLFLPIVSYLSYRVFGKTPGQFTFGIELRGKSGQRVSRIYDWLFSLSPRRPRHTPQTFQQIALCTGVLIFAFGMNVSIFAHDPTLRPFTTSKIDLYAPDPTDPNWMTLPYFYATGAVPLRLGTDLAEFSLPYERGPPHRFIGKIRAYWRGLDSRLTFTGPLTVGEPASQAKLAQCFSRWAGCTGVRRKIWRTSLGSFFQENEIEKNEWFTVDNDFLPPEERPQGIYLKSRPYRGWIREAYFLVGPKMAIQGLLLDRPDRAEGEEASKILAKMVGSIRLTADLDSPRAFINPKLAKLKIGRNSAIGDLISAEAHLIAKASVEPKDVESFYHLAGLAVTLYRRSKYEGRIELAASSKMIVKSSLQFVKDIDPASSHLTEMENFAMEAQ